MQLFSCSLGTCSWNPGPHLRNWLPWDHQAVTMPKPHREAMCCPSSLSPALESLQPRYQIHEWRSLQMILAFDSLPVISVFPIKAPGRPMPAISVPVSDHRTCEHSNVVVVLYHSVWEWLVKIIVLVFLLPVFSFSIHWFLPNLWMVEFLSVRGPLLFLCSLPGWSYTDLWCKYHPNLYLYLWCKYPQIYNFSQTSPLNFRALYSPVWHPCMDFWKVATNLYIN